MKGLRNDFDPVSASVSKKFIQLSTSSDSQKPVATGLGDNLVEGVLTAIRKGEAGHVMVSSSQCSVKPVKLAVDPDYDVDMDPRLKNWNNTLRCRRRLQERIAQRTGKRTEDVLFNRHVTIDEQTKRMLICLMDTAERHDRPTPAKPKGVLKGRVDPMMCREIAELVETEPKPRPFEFVGLPEISQMELASTVNPPESQWQRSKVLGERLESDKEKIKEVLSYCPQIALLQVASSAKGERYPVQKSQVVAKQVLHKISSDTDVDSTSVRVETEKEAIPLPAPSPAVGRNQVKVNGVVYGFGVSCGQLTGELHVHFQCDPMQRVRKTVVNLENIGTGIIHVIWLPNHHQLKTVPQHTKLNDDFLLDTFPFVLLPGDTRRVDVMFQPITVGVMKQRWNLSLHRSSFCGSRRLALVLHGVCTEPASYRDRLERDQRVVVEKQKGHLIKRLAKMHAEMTPLVEETALKCPYERPLDERELFNAQNPGFKCDRYADLETLKELHQLVKMPRHPAWDYSLDTLRQCIYQHAVDQRESVHSILVEVLDHMRCDTGQIAVDDLHLREQQERSCYLYVRGLICATIEDWQSLGDALAEQFFRSELQRYVNTLNAKGEAMPDDLGYIERQVSRNVLASKYFKDALYINTYTLICDTAENIVSAIESTRKF